MKTHEEFAALLDAFVDGELSPEEAGAVQEHLNNCPDCQACVDDLLAIRAAFPDAEETEVPAGFAQGVMAAIRAQDTPAAASKAPRRQPWLRVLVPVAACFALVLVLKTADSSPLSHGPDTPQTASSHTDPGPACQEAPVQEDAAVRDSDDEKSVMPAQEAPSAPPETPMVATDPASLPETYASVVPPPEPGISDANRRQSTEPEQVCFAQLLLTEAEAGPLLEIYTPIREVDGQSTYQLTPQEYEALLEELERCGIQPQFSMENTGAAVPDHAVALVVLQR